MKFKKILPLILTTALFLLFSTISHAWQGKVIKVTDGDTIEVLQSGHHPVTVRLYGIDTPEKSQWYGQNAKTFTSAQVMGKKVEVESVDKDRYGRTVGIVSIGNLVLNRHLVEYGYAWVYHRYCDRAFCSEWTESKIWPEKRKRAYGRILM